MDTVDDATCYININIPMKLFVFDTNSVTISNGRQTVRISVLHKVLGSEEDSNEVSEPVGPLVHDPCVGVHVHLDLVSLANLHHHALPHHAVLVVGVVVLVVETGNLKYD